MNLASMVACDALRRPRVGVGRTDDGRASCIRGDPEPPSGPDPSVPERVIPLGLRLVGLAPSGHIELRSSGHPQTPDAPGKGRGSHGPIPGFPEDSWVSMG